MEKFYQQLHDLGYFHPVHPTMTYLPIGGVMAAFLFLLLAVVFKRPNLIVSAKHCITLALVSVFPTVLFGYLDWQYFRGGNWIFPIIMKMILAAVLIVLLFITVLSQWRFKSGMKILLPLYGLCFINVAAIGYYGGELVFGSYGGAEKGLVARSEKLSQVEKRISFADVSQIFTNNCIKCHKGENAPLALQLDSYDHVMAGSLNGAVVVAGKPEESKLVSSLKGQSEPSMPFGQPLLGKNTVEKVVRWIDEGALQDGAEKK